MSTTTQDLAQFTNKRVIIVRNLPEPNEKGEGAVEIEGQVQIGNELGVVIKPKGQVKFDMIPAEEIEEIRLATEVSKDLKRSKLKVVELGSARRHLLERHGYTLAWVNSATEEQAFEHHASLDHEEMDLGHVHVNKEEKDASSDEGEGE